MEMGCFPSILSLGAQMLEEDKWRGAKGREAGVAVGSQVGQVA